MGIPAYDYILEVLQTTAREGKAMVEGETLATYQAGEVYHKMRELILAESAVQEKDGQS